MAKDPNVGKIVTIPHPRGGRPQYRKAIVLGPTPLATEVDRAHAKAYGREYYVCEFTGSRFKGFIWETPISGTVVGRVKRIPEICKALLRKHKREG